MVSNENLFKEEIFTKNEILDAVLAIYPEPWSINLTEEELSQIFIFERWSNFALLNNPIVDEYWNEYWCSEWYYMAQRIEDLFAKKVIAVLSKRFWLAREARYLYDLEQSEEKKVEYMRNAIREKFDNNPELKKELLSTGNKTIVEYTFRWDTFFWIDQETLKWKNVLWKLLMEYRDNNK